VQSLVRTEGPLSLYKGLESQLWRNAVWNGVYFGMIGGLKEEVLRPPPNSDKRTVMGYNFAAGVIGGTLATLVSVATALNYCTASTASDIGVLATATNSTVLLLQASQLLLLQ
jgi:Mitochondrial carrier protein